MLSFIKFNAEFDPERIVEAVIRAVPEHELDMSELEKANYHDYIRIMAEIEWPAFLDCDFEFHEQIIRLYNEGLFEKIKETIYNHYDAIYIKDLQDQLEASSVIKEGRIPILKEAFLLYQLGYFYGTASGIFVMVKCITNLVIQIYCLLLMAKFIILKVRDIWSLAALTVLIKCAA